jgi:hypothetical protein
MGLPQAPTLIIFVGGIGGSAAEEMVAAAHRAICLDTIERARATGIFERVIVVSDREELGRELGDSATVELTQGPFHFGRRLYQVIKKYDIERPFYIGGGAVPLLTSTELGAIAQQLSSASAAAITNNVYSADLIAFTPGSALEAVDLPARDNPLARLLIEQAGLKEVCLPRTAATQFDIDSPTDLLVLKVHPGAGQHSQAFLDGLDLDTSRLRQAIRPFTDTKAEVLVAGRVGSYLWTQLEGNTACRVRTLSEERGMRADGREEAGRVCSILGFYLEQVGATRFFDTLAELADAAFIDSRVIFNHLRLDLSCSDRFLSDLGQADKIENAQARQFTQAAGEAPIPVILGGHSLVAGGLLALIEAARLEDGGAKPAVDSQGMWG